MKSYLQSMNGREDFFPKSSQTKLDTYTLILFNPRCVKAADQNLVSSLMWTALDYMLQAQPGWFTQLPLRDNPATVYTHKNTNMSAFLCFSLPCLCPVSSNHRPVAVIQRQPESYLIAPGAIA